jgi:hypothetical protein
LHEFTESTYARQDHRASLAQVRWLASQGDFGAQAAQGIVNRMQVAGSSID